MQHKNKKEPVVVVSVRMADGTQIETIYSKETKNTGLCVYKDGDWRITEAVEHAGGATYVPTSSPLPDLGVLLLASSPEQYQSVESLVEEIRRYIHRYVDLPPSFEILVSYYVLLTWVHEAFAELGYIRFVGDLGSGKTRALNIVGAICLRALFASGAATVSPIFWFLDQWKGTLVFDETDFRASDMTSDMTKLFNNGSTKGFPILRQTVSQKGVMSPRAFQVFGPKIVSMRSTFEDLALESRFFTCEMGHHVMRQDVPINLPDVYKDEAAQLRNKLLLYRFQNLDKMQADSSLVDSAFSGRVNQILVPLLSVIPSEEHRHIVREAVAEIQEKQKARRSASVEAEVLEVVADLLADEAGGEVRLSDITALFVLRYGKDYERPITNRYVGEIVRSKLHIFSYKKRGVYVIPVSEREKVKVLAARYGIVKEKTGKEPTSGG